jgi:hypothetical protein
MHTHPDFPVNNDVNNFSAFRRRPLRDDIRWQKSGFRVLDF